MKGTSVTHVTHILFKHTSISTPMRLLVSLILIYVSWSFHGMTLLRKPRCLHPYKSSRRDSEEFINVPNVCFVKITSSYSNQEKVDILSSLNKRSLFNSIIFLDASDRIVDGPFPTTTSLSKIIPHSTTYWYSKATAMLKRVNDEPNRRDDVSPQWIPVTPGEEEVLVSNGWSFLDADESEPISSFDIDKANEQGQYVPKWYHPIMDNARPLSLLGYDLNPISSENLIIMADTVLSQRVQSRSVLLDGYTDPPGQKITNNGFDFSGSVQWNDVPKGIFICALGLLPLFATTDLKPCTAASGWLSFTQPVSNDHIILVYPKDSVQDPDGRDSSPDNRIEVICAKTGCHLGHYFGKDGGYCINASCLNFLPSPRDSVSAHVRKLWTEDPVDSYVHSGRLTPVSWKRFMAETLSPCDKLLLSVIQENASFIRVALGAGCFWHVEYALSRLPGVVHTVVGFAGGPKEVVKPSYAHVSKGDTGHAEMVLVTFDPQILSPNELFDCFFAMHDPTMVRAHGKRSQGSGQYRSCIMVNTDEMRLVADRAWNECQRSLGLGLSTEIVQVADIDERFWPAEDRHQLYEQRVKGRESSTLTLEQWMVEYARRSSSIWGSAETLTIAEDDDSDDGLARFLI